jgi:hypothetical protein
MTLVIGLAVIALVLWVLWRYVVGGGRSDRGG